MHDRQDEISAVKPRRRRKLRWALWGIALLAVWGGSIVASIQAWQFVTEKRVAIERRLGINEQSGVIETGLYFVQFQHVDVPREGRYGGLARLGDGVVHASRTGRLTFVGTDREARAMPVRIPVNHEQFEQDLTPLGLADADLFAVKDIEVQPMGAGARLIASYNFWDSERSCYWLRVASLLIPDVTDFETPESFGEWITHYDAAPCTPMGAVTSGTLRPALGAGGRLALVSDTTVLVTVGGGFASTLDALVDPETPFGKTVMIDLTGADSRIFTRGHRNQQGLARANDGTVYLTEHGDRGGDEINVLREGLDYGWPEVTYGTSYGSLELPANPVVGGHDGFEKPLFSWVPSIGASQLLVVEQPRFKNWQGDLLVTALRDQGVFRVRVDSGAVRYSEFIPIGYRLRDILETASGEIVILTDGGPLIYLTPLQATALDGSGNPMAEGRVLTAQCSACHSLDRDGPSAIGPPLWDVVGRRVASDPTYPYSDALQSVGGRWSKGRLRAYLRDAAGFAPGTSMQLTAPLTNAQVDAVIEYLDTLN